MNISGIFSAIEKGMSIISALSAAEKKIEPVVKVVFDLAKNAQTGDVTDQQLADAEAVLDQQIEDFNTPIE